jgi:sensor histidine kinase YesM
MMNEPGGGVWEDRARRWLAEPSLQFATSAVLFSVVAVVSATQLYTNWAAAGFETSFRAMVVVRLVDWLLWAAMVPAIVALDARGRRRARAWYAVAGGHVLVATLWFALQNSVPVLLAPWVDPTAAGQPFMEAYLARAAVRVSTAWVVYAAVLAVVALLRDFVRRQSLMRDLYDAQLRALRAQIQPHFLFNTLHTVGGLVRIGDRDQAIRTLVALSELLRRSLSHAHQDEVPLEDEIEFLEQYVAIQRARFGDHLTVVLSVDPVTRGARVPPLMLQPLIENAIRHGLDLDREPGSVSVDVRQRETRLRIRVEDDGGMLGREPASEGSREGGIGLSNLRDRLSRLYGHDQSLELALTASGATAVTVEIPMRRG